MEEAPIGRELPDDLTADALRRLPPRSLAVSRCVCRAWRDLIDARRLLRAHQLPRAVRGIFVEYYLLYRPEFLSRPSTAPSISGDLEFVPGYCRVEDHCNGLLLCSSSDHYYVANPATRRWARLPPRPASRMGEAFDQMECLVYDPTISPHYEVFFIPFLPYEPKSVLDDPEMLQSEWPPSPYPLQVFSSATGRWEERLFVRDGMAAGTIADVKDCRSWARLAKHAVYWRDALYVLIENGFFMRMSISNLEYRLIPVPEDIVLKDFNGCFYLGISQKGVYFAFNHAWNRLWIFLLAESGGQMVWEMKHRVDLGTFARKLNAREDYVGLQHEGPWRLQDINYYKYPYGNDNHKEAVDDNFEWSSDDDSVLNAEDMIEGKDDDSVLNAEDMIEGNYEKHKEAADDNFEWSSDDHSVLNAEDMIEGNYEKHKEAVDDNFECSSDDDSVLNAEDMIEGNYGKHKEAVDDNFEWCSDDDSVLNTEDMIEGDYCGYTTFLGFHPYKEIVFLNVGLKRAVAYHWNTSKFQDLGNISPKDYQEIIACQAADIRRSLPYTPCWMEFPGNKLEA